MRILLALFFSLLMVGCGTSQVYLEQDAALTVGPANLDRLFVVVEIQEFRKDDAVAMVTYRPACDSTGKLNMERFVLKPGESFTTRLGETISLLGIDIKRKIAMVRGSMLIEVENGLFPRKPHPLEKPMPVHPGN